MIANKDWNDSLAWTLKNAKIEKIHEKYRLVEFTTGLIVDFEGCPVPFRGVAANFENENKLKTLIGEYNAKQQSK